MKVFTYSEARQKLAKVLDLSKTEEVVIRRRSGETFRIVYEPVSESPFDVPGVKTDLSLKEILDAVQESRARSTMDAKSRDV